MKILYYVCCVIYRIVFRTRRIKNWYYENAIKGYCLLRNVRFNPSKVEFNGNSYFLFATTSKISFGDGFICATGGIDNSTQSKIIVNDNATLSIGDYSGITNTIIQCHKKIEIGSYVNIGAGTMLLDTDFHSTKWRDRSDRNTDTENRKMAPIKIGNYVFIGTKCIITKGVNIGDKSIVAAGSVVVKDIPTGEIWGGNPARFLKKIEE